MERNSSCALIMAALVAMINHCPAQAANTAVIPNESEEAERSWENNLEGPVQGKIEFAQTHVVDVPRSIVDPLLVPGREALVMFTPRAFVPVSSVSLVVESPLGDVIIPMAPPSSFPQSAVFDQENTFSGRPIEGRYVKFRDRAFTATNPRIYSMPRMVSNFSSMASLIQWGV